MRTPQVSSLVFAVAALLVVGCDDATEPGICPSEPLEERCEYSYMYGQTCTVPCSAPPGCTFRVVVDWSDSHCCERYDSWSGCVCEDGRSVCPATPGAPREIPSTTCHPCDGSDAGTDAGGPSDAALDADDSVDAATADAATTDADTTDANTTDAR